MWKVILDIQVLENSVQFFLKNLYFWFILNNLYTNIMQSNSIIELTFDVTKLHFQYGIHILSIETQLK